MKRALVSWSGGKDAAWALHRMRAHYEIAALFTTLSEADGNVPVHNVHASSIARQAAALGLPLWTVPLPQPCANAEYAARLSGVWERATRERIDVVIFGDLFLTDIRAWREQLLAPTRLTVVFPLWQEPTSNLAREMLREGLRATVCAVDETRIGGVMTGRPFDEQFLSDLPRGADPCGENGEFHTFVTDMPGFQCAVSYP